MAIITFNDDTHREVPDDARMTDLGITWADGDSLETREYVVPWASVKTFEHPQTEPFVG